MHIDLGLLRLIIIDTLTDGIFPDLNNWVYWSDLSTLLVIYFTDSFPTYQTKYIHVIEICFITF